MRQDEKDGIITVCNIMIGINALSCAVILIALIAGKL